MEAAAAAGAPGAEAAGGKGGPAAAALAAGFRDSERWAHALPQPETGCILLAHPSMFGQSQQYFNLAAILILECSDSGALGIILNRPTQHRIGDVRFTSDDLMDPFQNNRLYMGGDVGASSVIVLSKSAAVEDATEIAAGIRVVTLSAAAEAVASGRARPSDFRFFAQYAGWGPGQLQRECKAGVWFMSAVSSPLALNEELADGPGLWHEILTTMGGPYTQVSQLVNEGRSRLSPRELQPGDEGSGL